MGDQRLSMAAAILGIAAVSIALSACSASAPPAATASVEPGVPMPSSSAPSRALPEDCGPSSARRPCAVPDERPQHVYVAIMDNLGGTPWSDDQVLAGIASAGDYWLRNLAGVVSAVDVAGIVHYESARLEDQLASGEGCRVGKGQLPGGWLDLQNLSFEAGENFPDADFSWGSDDMLVFMPPAACTMPDGLPDLTAGQVGYNAGPGNIAAWQIWSPNPAAGVDDVDFNVRRLTHEMGHNLGLAHTLTGWCESADPGCPNADGPDPSNIMGVNTYGLLTTAQRSLFGALAVDEFVDFELADGEDSAVQQFTIASLDRTSGLRAVRITAPADQGSVDAPQYWLNYLPGLPDGAAQADIATWPDLATTPSGLLVQRLITGKFSHGLLYDIVSENASHDRQQFHLWQPGETYVNYDGSVQVRVDSMEPDAGLTVTVTLTR